MPLKQQIPDDDAEPITDGVDGSVLPYGGSDAAPYVAVDGRQAVFSEGHRLLLCAPGSLSQIASAVGVSKQVVSMWRQGRKVPSVGARLRLQTAFGIDAEAWAHEPTGQAPEPPQRAPAARAAPPEPPPPAAARPTPAPLPEPVAPVVDAPAVRPAKGAGAPAGKGAAPSTMDGVETLLRTIREHRKKPGLLAAESVKLADAETRLLSLKHKLEKETEMAEDRFVRLHPQWLRIKQAIATTLVRWPDAARAVAATLKEIEK